MPVLYPNHAKRYSTQERWIDGKKSCRSTRETTTRSACCRALSTVERPGRNADATGCGSGFDSMASSSQR